MVYSALFYLVFISQIVVISFYLPRRLVELATQDAVARGMGLQPGTGRKLASYTRMNHLIVALGLVLLAAFIFFDLTTSVTAVLASIGAYFLLQLSPLATPAVRRLMEGIRAAYSQTAADREPTPDSGRLLDTVSLLQVGIALGLSAIWLVIKLLAWNGEMNTQLLNIGIFVGGHLFIAALVARNLRVLKRGGAGQNGGNKGIEDPRLAIPLLIYVSIGLSIYSLAKQLLLDLDLHHIRPIMMSFSLLLLATLAFDRQIRDLRQQPASSSADTARQS